MKYRKEFESWYLTVTGSKPEYLKLNNRGTRYNNENTASAYIAFHHQQVYINKWRFGCYFCLSLFALSVIL